MSDYGYPGPTPYDPSAEDALPTSGELFGPASDPLAAVERARHQLGLEGAEQPVRRQSGPDVTGLAEHLGLR